MHDIELDLRFWLVGGDYIGKLIKPSVQAMNTALVPQFLSSVSTESQNLAPSFSDSQKPKNSFFWSA